MPFISVLPPWSPADPHIPLHALGVFPLPAPHVCTPPAHPLACPERRRLPPSRHNTPLHIPGMPFWPLTPLGGFPAHVWAFKLHAAHPSAGPRTPSRTPHPLAGGAPCTHAPLLLLHTFPLPRRTSSACPFVCLDACFLYPYCRPVAFCGLPLPVFRPSTFSPPAPASGPARHTSPHPDLKACPHAFGPF